MISREVEADVLIIGGGSAGCMAAIKAKDTDPSLKVVVMEKSNLRRSGAISRGMDALNIVAVPGISTPEEYVQSIIDSCEGILDKKLCYRMAEKSFTVLKELEEWGVKFAKENGYYKVFQVHSKGKFLVPMDAPDLKPLLASLVMKKGVIVYNWTVATSLITENGRVIGATGLNIREGSFLVFKAKSIILTTGAAGRFGIPTSGYLFGTYEFPGNAGDGYSIAYRAGAELTGFEYTVMMALIKYFDGPAMYIVLPRGGEIVNAIGEVLKGEKTGYPGVPVMKIWREFQEGRGPVYLKATHLPEDSVKEIEDILFKTERPTLKKFFEGRGMNFRKNLIELSLSGPYLCSGHGITGLVVNEKAETSLKGLYAAGDVAAVPMQHLTGAFVYGAIAGEEAANIASKINYLEVDEEKVKEERIRVFTPALRQNGLKPLDVEFKLRKVISDYLTPPKSESKLKAGLNHLRKIKEDLKLIKAEDTHELLRALETQFILDCAELSFLASLERRESRWGLAHFRLDYPMKDDINWKKFIIVKKNFEIGEPMLFTRPVE